MDGVSTEIVCLKVRILKNKFKEENTENWGPSDVVQGQRIISKQHPATN